MWFFPRYVLYQVNLGLKIVSTDCLFHAAPGTLKRFHHRAVADISAIGQQLRRQRLAIFAYSGK